MFTVYQHKKAYRAENAIKNTSKLEIHINIYKSIKPLYHLIIFIPFFKLTIVITTATFAISHYI